MQFLFPSLLSRKICRVLVRNIRLSRTSHETHYDVLKLPQNCTTKDIKNSFIKLSKEYHPDKNANDPDRHSKFVKLNEAYTVLSRPETRREYDLSLVPGRYGVHRMHSYTRPEDPRKPVYDPSFYANRDKSKDGENIHKPYYGIKGVPKMSNLSILWLCLTFAAAGVAFQVLLIRKSVSFRRSVLDEQSRKNAQILKDVRRSAAEFGDDALLNRMRDNEERNKKTSNKEE